MSSEVRASRLIGRLQATSLLSTALIVIASGSALLVAFDGASAKAEGAAIASALGAVAATAGTGFALLAARRETRRAARAASDHVTVVVHGARWTVELEGDIETLPTQISDLAEVLSGRSALDEAFAELTEDGHFGASIERLSSDVEAGVERPFDSLEERLRRLDA